MAYTHGAVLVKGSKVIGRGYNSLIRSDCKSRLPPLGVDMSGTATLAPAFSTHAEMAAIRSALPYHTKRSLRLSQAIDYSRLIVVDVYSASFTVLRFTSAPFTIRFTWITTGSRGVDRRRCGRLTAPVRL